MREIKFRMWDEIRKIMCPVTQMNILDDEHVLMQYTGLHDRKGVEIYEGDIMGTSYKGFEVGVVEFHTGSYVLRGSVKECMFKRTEQGYTLTLCEVIGNIYENPELLEDIT